MNETSLRGTTNFAKPPLNLRMLKDEDKTNPHIRKRQETNIFVSENPLLDKMTANLQESLELYFDVQTWVESN